MTDFEERFRSLLRDVTSDPPATVDRTPALRRGITRRRRYRTAGVAGAVVLVLAGASVGLVTLKPSAHHPLGVAPAASAASTATVPKGPENILLAGEDQDDRADAIMILHLAADHRTGYLISIPRDIAAQIPAYDNGTRRYPGGRDRLGSAYAYGARGLTGTAARQHGIALLSKTVTALTGVTFNATVSADYTGLQQVINAIGGINLYVDEETTSIDVGYDRAGKETRPYTIGPKGVVTGPVPGVTPFVFTVGEHHLTGWQALDYIRQRDLLAKADGEYGRQRHQAQLLKAVYGQVLRSGTLTNPQRLGALLTAVRKTLTIDGGGASLTGWLSSVRGLPANGLVGVAVNGGRYDTASDPVLGDVQVLSDTSRQLLDAVRADTVGQFVATHPDWVITAR